MQKKKTKNQKQGIEKWDFALSIASVVIAIGEGFIWISPALACLKYGEVPGSYAWYWPFLFVDAIKYFTPIFLLVDIGVIICLINIYKEKRACLIAFGLFSFLLIHLLTMLITCQSGFLLSFKMTTSFLAVTAALLCVAILLINVLSVIGYIFGWKCVKISGKLSLALSVIVALFGLALTVAFMQSLIRAA